MIHANNTLKDCLAHSQLLESILNAAGDPVMAIAFDRQIIWMNHPASQLGHPIQLESPIALHNSCHWVLHGLDKACGHDTPCALDLVEANRCQTKLLREITTVDGASRVYEVLASPLLDGHGEAIGIVKTLRDVTEQQCTLARLNENETALKQLAHHDPLTGLANRTLAMERIGYAIRLAHRSGNMVGLIYIDLVDFKVVNDTLGHEMGDIVLKKVAQRLSSIVREGDTVARLGGDEFLIILDRLKSAAEAGIVANKLLTAMREPIPLHSRIFNVSGSFGISLYPTDSEDADTLVRHADMAMYRAKRSGSLEAHYYANQIRDAQIPGQDNNLKHALEKATERDFLLLYQPVVNLADNRIIKVEALLRWNSAESGLHTPDSFLSLAEKSGLINALDDWVLLTVCQQYMDWQRQGFKLPCISVNLSAKQLARSDLPSRLNRILKATGCPAQALELELSELSVMTDPEHTREVLGRLGDMGISLCIDDYGAGYSSLNQLKLLPISHLKLDRSLVRQLPGNGRDVAVARAIMALGQSMKMKVVAKGIETEDQRNFLRTEGCDHGQGYFYSKPVSPDHIARQLTQ
ncbi:MAG: EAL domain-containing protein [Hydrogenophilales bacterium]|nr:EAL domain-containing protein [Hydrogenophilales bacterium]